MKGVDKIDLEQQFTTEIKYSLDIQQDSDSDIHTHGTNINLDSDFSGVILNSTLQCEPKGSSSYTDYQINQQNKISIECGENQISASLTRPLEKRFSMINYQDTLNTLGGINGWV